MAYCDFTGYFCCSRYLLKINAKNRKAIDANILLMTQRPLQKITYNWQKTRKWRKTEHTILQENTLKVNKLASAVQI